MILNLVNRILNTNGYIHLSTKVTDSPNVQISFEFQSSILATSKQHFGNIKASVWKWHDLQVSADLCNPSICDNIELYSDHKQPCKVLSYYNTILQTTQLTSSFGNFISDAWQVATKTFDKIRLWLKHPTLTKR